MIPAFPQFKKIDSNDRSMVESCVNQFPPYSDFNFTSLWAWDTRNERMVSLLNGNLVVKFTDYGTGEPFFSFLGTNNVDDTAAKIIDHAKISGVSPILRLVPAISAEGIVSSALKIEEDRDNFDYIYSTTLLSELQGSSFKDLRRSVNKFARDYPKSEVRIVHLQDKGVEENIWSVLRLWNTNKIIQGKGFEIEHEKSAMLRLFESSDTNNFIVTTVMEEGRTFAFSIEELLPNQYCMGHFWKADIGRPGIYNFLLQAIAQYLRTQNVDWWNFEQDLGIEGLRRSKMSFSPVTFLKKYKVSLVGGN